MRAFRGTRLYKAAEAAALAVVFIFANDARAGGYLVPEASSTCPGVNRKITLSFDWNKGVYDITAFRDFGTELLLTPKTDFTVCYSAMGGELMKQIITGCLNRYQTDKDAIKYTACNTDTPDAIQDAIAFYSQAAAKNGAKLPTEPDTQSTGSFDRASCPLPVDPYKEQTLLARKSMDSAKCVNLDIPPKGKTTCTTCEKDVENIGTPIGRTGYRLKRNSENEYEAMLNVSFLLPSKTSEADPTLHNDSWKNMAQSCLDKFVNPHLSGPPKNKKKLKVTIGGSGPARPVYIARESIRDNSGVWSPVDGCGEAFSSRAEEFKKCMSDPKNVEARCPTIAHELFHLLGLVDEYEEHLDGHIVNASGTRITPTNKGEKAKKSGESFVAQFDCRILGPENSLMSDQSMAFLAMKGYQKIQVCSCSDPDDWSVSRSSGPDPCLKSIAKAKISGDKCSPVGDFWESYVTPDSEHYGHDSGDVKKRHKYISVGKPVKKRPNLLFAGQFRAIVYPGCGPAGKTSGEGGNDTYIKCASEAYKTSPKAFGKARCGDSLPKACKPGVPGSEWLL